MTPASNIKVAMKSFFNNINQSSEITPQTDTSPSQLIRFFAENGKEREIELVPVPKTQTTSVNQHAAKTAKIDATQTSVPLEFRNARKSFWPWLKLSISKSTDRQQRMQSIQTSNNNTLTELKKVNVLREDVAFLFFEDQFLSGSVGIILTHAIKAKNFSDKNESLRERHRKQFFSEAEKFAVSLFHNNQRNKGKQVLSGLMREYPDLFYKWLQKDVNKNQLKQVIWPFLSEFLTDQNNKIEIQDLLQIITVKELLQVVTLEELLQLITLKNLLQIVTLKDFVSAVKKEDHSTLFRKLREAAYIPNTTSGSEFSDAVLTVFLERINQSLVLTDTLTADNTENPLLSDDWFYRAYNDLNIPREDKEQLKKDLPRWLDVVFFEDTSLLKEACKFIQEIKKSQISENQKFFKRLTATIPLKNKDQILEEIHQFADSDDDFEKETKAFNSERLKTLKQDFLRIHEPAMFLSFLFANKLKELLQVDKLSKIADFIKAFTKGFTQGVFADINVALVEAYKQLAEKYNSPLYCKPSIVQPKIKMNLFRVTEYAPNTLVLRLTLESSSTQIGIVDVNDTKTDNFLFQIERNDIPNDSYNLEINLHITRDESGNVTATGISAEASLTFNQHN